MIASLLSMFILPCRYFAGSLRLQCNEMHCNVMSFYMRISLFLQYINACPRLQFNVI